jgi:hypothetical protein
MSNAAAVEALFFAALEREAAAERAAYLDRTPSTACWLFNAQIEKVFWEKILDIAPAGG